MSTRTATQNPPALGSKEEISKKIQVRFTPWSWRWAASGGPDGDCDCNACLFSHGERDCEDMKDVPYLSDVTATLGAKAACNAILIQRELVEMVPVWKHRLLFPESEDADDDSDGDFDYIPDEMDLADDENLAKFGEEVLLPCDIELQYSAIQNVRERCPSFQLEPRWQALCAKLDLDRFRAQLKQWELDFAKAHGGAKPTRDDIKSDRSIAEVYKKYHALKGPTPDNTGPHPSPEPENETENENENNKRKAKDEHDSTRDAKKLRHEEGLPSESKGTTTFDREEPRRSDFKSVDQICSNAWLLLFTSVTVKESYRRQGLGTLLVQALLQQVIARAQAECAQGAEKRIVLAFAEPRSLVPAPDDRDDVDLVSGAVDEPDDEAAQKKLDAFTQSQEKQRREDIERAVPFWKSLTFEPISGDATFFMWSPASETAPSLFKRGSKFSSGDGAATIVDYLGN